MELFGFVILTAAALVDRYGAVRLEWTDMVLGQSAGAAAALALEENVAVQDVPYAELAERLRG